LRSNIQHSCFFLASFAAERVFVIGVGRRRETTRLEEWKRRRMGGEEGRRRKNQCGLGNHVEKVGSEKRGVSEEVSGHRIKSDRRIETTGGGERQNGGHYPPRHGVKNIKKASTLPTRGLKKKWSEKRTGGPLCNQNCIVNRGFSKLIPSRAIPREG